jgi:uridylate kinase
MKKKIKLAIKIGGSIAFDEKGPKRKYFKKLIPVINKVRKNTSLLILGIGGGKYIRNYYLGISGLGLSEKKMEWLGIDLLKANANLLSFLFSGKSVFNLNKIPKAKVLTVAGIKPGRSTDANTALLAEKFKVDLFIMLTNVAGLYTKDPKRCRNARLLKKIGFDELNKFFPKRISPGKYGIIDPLALKVIKRSKIHTFIINGKNPKIILDILKGKKRGTKIY